MADDLKKILNLINDIKSANDSNAQSFDRLLSTVSEKLDLSNENSAEIVKSYINELNKSLDDKYSFTAEKFENIENALKIVYQAQNESVKNSDIRELFDVFSKNVNNFYTEAKQEKAILASIEGRLSELINNKSDKEDIMRTVALLRKDFENINYAYRSVIDDVNTNLKSIISGLVRLDPLKSNDGVRSQIEVMFNSVNSILIHLQGIDNRYDKLEQILATVATDEDLKHAADMLKTLIEKTEAIEQKVDNLAPKADVDDIKDICNSNKNIFQSLIEKTNSIEEFMANSNIKDGLTSVSTSSENLAKKTENIETSLDSISDYIHENLPVNLDYIKEQLASIKSTLEKSKNTAQVVIPSDLSQDNSTLEYISQLKELVENTNINSDINDKLIEIQDALVNYNTHSENGFAKVFSKIDAFEQKLSQSNFDIVPDNNAIAGFEQLKVRLDNLSENFKGTDDAGVQNFIKERLSDLYADLDKLTSASEERIKQGFVYSSELLEEKTDAILKFVREVKASGTNIENLEPDLTGFKEELNNLNKDMRSHIENMTQSLIDEFIPLKEMIEKLDVEQYIADIKFKLDDLHGLFIDNGNVEEHIENLYHRVSKDIANTENKLKDFVLSDTDALIIKMDNLREYMEEAFKSVAPPDADKMKGLYEFASSINNFKHVVLNNISDIATDNAIRHEELKSMLSTAKNHDDIINAIEDLRITFRNKLSKLTKGKVELSEGETAQVDESEYTEVLKELKKDYNRFTGVIENLSAKNTDIEEILALLTAKIDSIIENKAVIEDDEAYNITEEGEGAETKPALFDFEQALDLLKKGMNNLKTSVDKILYVQKKQEETPAPAPFAPINTEEIVSPLTTKIETLLDGIKNSWFKEFRSYIDNRNLDNVLQSINNKLDYMAGSASTESNIIEGVSGALDTKVTNKIDALNAKLDVLASGEDIDLLSELTTALDDIDYKMSESETQITGMLGKLNEKIDFLSKKGTTADTTEFENSIQEVKDLIDEQQTYIGLMDNTDDEKIEAFKKCLDELTQEVDNLVLNTNDGNKQLKDTLKEMKDSLMNAVVTIFDQVSFIEETEDIKDFVEERTDEITRHIEGLNDRLELFATTDDITEKLKNVATSDDIQSNIAEITKQLKMLSTTDDSDDYIYTMQDIETDLAKLRLALNEIQTGKLELQSNELAQISEKLHTITSSVDLLTQDEIKELKSELATLKEQTQFIIATSDKSYDALNNGIEDFGQMINASITQKVDRVAQMLEDSATSDSMVRQSLIYMGEWIDSASESINKISANANEIEKVVNTVVNVENMAQDNQQQFEKFADQLEKFQSRLENIDNLEEQLQQQQQRIDRLEISIDKVLDALGNIDDTEITKKIDRIEKQIAKLSSGIEKLTSYVE